jgi:hypothetical protein
MRYVLAVVLLAGVGAGAGAQTTVPHTFVAGTPAKAADVNENFLALVTAINNLTARVSSLESPATSAASVAGTYSLQSLDIELDFTQGTGASTTKQSTAAILSTSTNSQLILNANGSFTSSGTSPQMGIGWTGGFGPVDSLFETSGALFLPFIPNSSASSSGGWSVSGNVLTLSVGRSTVVFTGSGGRLFVAASSDRGSNSLTNHLFVLIRTN